MIAPVPENEAARLYALQQYQILDTEPEEVFDGLSRLAAYICGTPIALISLVDKDRQWFKSKFGLNTSETPRSVSFCAYAIAKPDVFIVPDASADERFVANPLVATYPHVRFYAGCPLVTLEGHALGTLCVLDRIPRELSIQQIEMLQILRHQIITQFELRRNLAALGRMSIKSASWQCDEESRVLGN